MARPLLRNYHQKDLMLGYPLCPVDRRIQAFLNDYLKDICPQGAAQLPGDTFLLDRPGLARALSLPLGGNTFACEYLQSYRVQQGILHNPRSDRRTTQGIFHIVEGGFPVPADKQAVPKQAFASLLDAALRPPTDLLDSALHGRSARARAAIRLAAAASARLSCHRNAIRKSPWRSGSSRPAAW